MVHYRLLSVQQRGLGEPARMMFHYAKQPFEDQRFSTEEVQVMKSKLPYGQLPLLEVDGKALAQSYAIYRYLGHQFGLAGKDAFEAAQIDSFADHFKDLMSGIDVWFGQMFGMELKDKENFEKETLRPALAKLSEAILKALDDSGSGFLAPSGPCWLDFYVTERMYTFGKTVPGVFEKYPGVSEYIRRFQSLPQIKEYIDSREDTLW